MNCTPSVLQFKPQAAADAYAVSVTPSFAAELDLWSRMAERGASLSFQSRDWLDSWVQTIGQRNNLDLLAVTIRDGGGRPVMGLPLVRERRRLRRIGFADGGLADYNAPILDSEAPQDAASAARLWSALKRALPKTDLICFERMPSRIGSMTNPLSLLPTRPAADRGLDVHLPGSYAEWRQAFPRRYRKELGRCGRIFDALPGARFVRVRENSAPVFDALERLQRERIEGLQLPYYLDEPDARGFYRHLGADLTEGPGVLTALVTDDDIVAALFGVRHGSRYLMLRIAADARYGRMSPARDLIVRTIQDLRSEGIEHFDFGLGDYDYKRKLGGSPIELHDLVVPCSPAGTAVVAMHELKVRLREFPRALAAAKAVRRLVRL